MNVEDRIRTGLHDQASRVDVELPPVEDVFGHARRATVKRGAGAAAAVAAVLVVGVVLVTGRIDIPGVEVVDQPDEPVSTLEVTLLDATQLRLTLPEQLVEGLAQPELAGSLYAADSLDDITTDTAGWRIDAHQAALEAFLPDGEPIELPTASTADAAVLDQADRRLGVQFGSWVVVASGDTLDTDLLLSGIDVTATPDGFLEYQGALTLWTVDARDLRLHHDDTTLSVFLRSCSSPSDESTPAGLRISHIDDPNRGDHLTVLCDIDQRIEIWLEAPTPTPDTSLERIDIEIVTAGSTLTAIQDDHAPVPGD